MTCVYLYVYPRGSVWSLCVRLRLFYNFFFLYEHHIVYFLRVIVININIIVVFLKLLFTVYMCLYIILLRLYSNVCYPMSQWVRNNENNNNIIFTCECLIHLDKYYAYYHIIIIIISNSIVSDTFCCIIYIHNRNIIILWEEEKRTRHSYFSVGIWSKRLMIKDHGKATRTGCPV